MNSPLLKKLSKRNQGWRPKSIHDDNGLIRNACMVSNGSVSLKVEVPVLNDLDKMDKLLEVQVIKAINELNERDDAIIKRQTLIFSVLASATVNQAEMFIGLMHHDGKQELNNFIRRTERLVKSIQKDFVKLAGKQMEDLLVDLEEAAVKVFGSLGTAIDEGKILDFVDYVESFKEKEDGKVVEMSAVKKESKPFPCTSCGACCMNVGKMLDIYEDLGVKDPTSDMFFPHKIYKTGRCSKLNKDNQCSVYDNRPEICNMAKMQERLNIPSKEFEEMNIAGCNSLMDEMNIPLKFRIPVDKNSTKPKNLPKK